MSHHHPHNRATTILPHHRFGHSLGAPLIHCEATVSKVFAGPENHGGANHQHFDVTITKVLTLDGAAFDADTLLNTQAFVAVRFGDMEGLDAEIEDLIENTPIELQGEYIAVSEAYPTQDNADPKLPVIHFTHHPIGFVVYEGKHYS